MDVGRDHVEWEIWLKGSPAPLESLAVRTNTLLRYLIRVPPDDEVPSVFADLARADSHQALDCSTLSLAEWIEAYLAPHGELYDPAEHVHRWPPGGRGHYCNISYGLLAVLAERVGDAPFDTLCRERIVEPLGMTSTAWVLPDVDPARHASPTPGRAATAPGDRRGAART